MSFFGTLIRLSVFAFFLPVILQAAGISYTVDFEGLNDPSALKAIKSVSQLTSLQKHPPASINAIRYRAESDIPEFLKALHAYGYYEGTVHVNVQEVNEKVQVNVALSPGPIYKIKAFSIHLYNDTPENKVSCEKVKINHIGIVIGSPALSQSVIEAELKSMQILSGCGYPLATVDKRDIVVDGKTKTLSVDLYIKTGPMSYFGPASIEGNASVKSSFVRRKIQWEENTVYDSEEVEKTQKELMDTGLFNSILISHAETPSEDGTLAMKIEVSETKHKSIDIGVSYQTIWGPGATFGWENRNVGGMGRTLSFQGDITKNYHSGILTYFLPDFHREGQDYIWEAEAMHEEIKAYSERSYSLTNRVEEQFGRRIHLSVGGEVERLYVTESVHNGNFVLLELPINLRWSTANSLLNPTKGITIEYLAVPTMTVTNAQNFYLIQQLQVSDYIPLTSNHIFVLAQKITFGTILSKSLNAVPVPKRFLGGSEDELRGYQYRTVSKIAKHHHHRPIGGRSAIYYSFEPRFRVSNSIGLVPFFDIGNVYSNPLPTFGRKWFKSVGIGVRYFSVIGPFRLDVAFPLDRRKHLDTLYKIYVSVGQMF
ncbi:MAG TPA: BamA/TamA family outer membrane protein [Rhabdochlamydiaceae bacterium]|nr:BamA/TamA family outer membrane protein [Rhabdochlamydiaceae bacterium]